MENKGWFEVFERDKHLNKTKRDNKAKDEIEMMMWESRVWISPS